MILAGLLLCAALLTEGATDPEEDATTGSRTVDRARTLLSLGEARAATAVLEDYLNGDPSFAPAWLWLAICRNDLLLSSEALRAALRAVELTPSDAQANLLLGNLHFVRLEKDLAAAQYRRVLAIDSANAAARENLGRLEEEARSIRSFRTRAMLVLLGALIEIFTLFLGGWLVLKKVQTRNQVVRAASSA